MNKDLMIGDIIYRPDCYDRVVEIRSNGIIGMDSNRGLIPFDELKPIEITPEILEKNGWKSYSHEDTPIFGTIQGFEIVLSWMDYYWQLCVDGTVYRKIKIRYVHELQHVLRLCGIENKIEL